MAKAKQFAPPNDILLLINSTTPETPVLSSKEKTYFKGLKRRGYSEQQISEFVKKAGYLVPSDFFLVKPKKPKAASV